MNQNDDREKMKEEIKEKYSKLFNDLADERKDSLGTIHWNQNLFSAIKRYEYVDTSTLANISPEIVLNDYRKQTTFSLSQSSPTKS